MPKTGATRYQKFLKSEKGKTKLKAKKDLPKGTNVTKTNFKVKKIVIKEQLKKHDEGEALSRRKLNYKELLTRVNHFNTNSRTDALGGLHGLITSRPDVLDQNLGLTILGITPLLLHVEKIVRRDTLKVLHLVVTLVTSEKIEPFFDIMSTYLRSAMTHIDSRIQDDSLLFLDFLLQYTSERMARDFHKIIPNFLDMISKLRIDSKPGRTLTVNMDSQITTVKWRVKVLHRLQEYLLKYIEHNDLNKSDGSGTKAIEFFDQSKPNHYPLFNPTFTAVCPLSCFSPRNAQETAIPQDEVNQFKSYMETLMPLLFETWLEACPSGKSDNNTETVVNEDAAFLLKHTLEVMSSVWKITKHLNKNNPSSNIELFFMQKYRQSFSQHIFRSFPYVTNLRSVRNTISVITVFEHVITDSKLVLDNLEICHLYIALNPNVNMKQQHSEVSALLNYIERTFNQNTKADVNDLVINILQTIFSSEVTGWTKNVALLDALFRKIVWGYFNQEMPKEFRQKLFILLCKIALNDKLSHFHSTDAYDKWLKQFPDILLEATISYQTVDIIHKFCVRNNKIFNMVVQPKLLNIVENLPNIKLIDAYDETSIHKLFSILFWIRCWDTDSLNKLENQLLDGVYESDHAKYIFDTLRMKSEGIFQ